MKYWNKILKEGLTYEFAKQQREEGEIVTRPCWDGVHFNAFNHTWILEHTGELIMCESEDDIWDRDKNDWIVVELTKEISETFNKKFFSLLHKEDKTGFLEWLNDNL